LQAPNRGRLHLARYPLGRRSERFPAGGPGRLPTAADHFDLRPSTFDRDVAGRHCIGSLLTDIAVSWLTMQSAANPSRPHIPCLQGIYQGNFADSAPRNVF